MMHVVSNIFNARNWPILALLLSFGLWMGALGFQYIGNMHPCQMCYWQRHAHKAVIVISALALINRYGLKTNKWDRIFLGLIGLAFLTSFGLAFWHTGVEYTWWEGPKSCMGGAVTIDPADILQALETPVKMPSCGEVPWSMLGLSMAGYNAILSLGAAIMSFLFVVKAK
ncbi:MAG: disulfide bond formation protein B [Robiginitomaculum sp.]|nr:disulfide bond formation protein B [Robiginitomaculum sp.]